MFLGLKHGAPAIAAGGGGVIVNWSSAIVLKSGAMTSAFAAAKAGVVQLTRSAAVEFGPDNVRVNALLPGAVRTPSWEDAMKMVPDAKQTLTQMVAPWPIKRVGEPREVANAALFLCSDSASYLTGVALPVDGGSTLV